MAKISKQNKEVIPIEEYNEKQKELSLTKQQRFNFDDNKYEDDKETKKKRKNSVSIKIYLDLKRKFVKSEKEKNKYRNYFKFLSAISIILFLMTLLFIYIHITYEPKYIEKEKIVKQETILFLGDSITQMYELNNYYSDKYFVINSGISGNITNDILDNMDKRVYQYKPKKVFILIGTNDFGLRKNSDDELIQNIDSIIKAIKDKFPECKIYLESIYPINDTDDSKIDHSMVGIRTNDKIINLNKRFKDLAKDDSITYIDVYSKLIDDEGNLKLEYTRDGLHISDAGYKIITKVLSEYL